MTAMPDPPEESQQGRQDDPVVSSAAADQAANQGPGWFRRVSAVIFVIFCFELGLFLLIYPWTGAWSDNYFAWALPGAMRDGWHTFWSNSYIRGAVSGLGILNVWVAITEVFAMFGRRGPAVSQSKG